ncbi:hypothetical protein KI387_003449, partial [Taxus chinensis]
FLQLGFSLQIILMMGEEETIIKEEPWDEYVPMHNKSPKKKDFNQNLNLLPSGWVTGMRTRKCGLFAGKTYK